MDYKSEREFEKEMENYKNLKKEEEDKTNMAIGAAAIGAVLSAGVYVIRKLIKK